PRANHGGRDRRAQSMRDSRGRVAHAALPSLGRRSTAFGTRRIFRRPARQGGLTHTVRRRSPAESRGFPRGEAASALKPRVAPCAPTLFDFPSKKVFRV